MFAKKDAIVAKSNVMTSDIGSSIIRYDTAFFKVPSTELFSEAYWRKQNAITGHAQGRGTTWFFKLEETELVLRHYYRGGLIGKFLNDQYLYTGFRNSRAYREFELLSELHSLNLPAPKPVAIRVKKVLPCFCVSDIISSKIIGASDLVYILTKRSLREYELRSIGFTVRRFHDHNIYHHDLNAHNILLDEDNQASLIDFDQGEIRANTGQWKQNNLDRLLRSFKKEQGRLDNFHWNEQSWQHLLNGYSSHQPP